MVFRMPNLLNCKGQFFIVSVVGIIIIIYALSKILSPYTIPDLSEAPTHNEIFFFNNVKEKLIKTVKINECEELESNIEDFIKLASTVAAENGYKLRIRYSIADCDVFGNITLTSEDMELNSKFFISKD
ncbi:MAG TPA: hypothetical protein ENG45_00745 [Candidatus Aenigmarchaeota archaeon]|nr:hypothetical protein [Candidatus Aenigmarchaeota archaeon]